MGAATARLLARERAKVVIADMLEREGRHVAENIGDSAHFEGIDVTDEANSEAVVGAIAARFGRLNVLVNNAGISGSAEQDFHSTDAWHRIMAVNAAGTFYGIKYAVPAMRKARGGSIVNPSSIASITGSEHAHMAYNASKAARSAADDQTGGGAVREGRHAGEFGASGDHAADAHFGAERRSGDTRRSHAVHSKAPAGRGGRGGECHPVADLR